jgi:hypothetical protein
VKVAVHEWAGDTFRARIRNNAAAFYPTKAQFGWANRRIAYHERMARRWAQAANRPWQTETPDPPEPE